ncbi:heterokaryon incompatibility protein-domain-containing protein [Xylariaceae sp. FL0016]|nr:heterokaryon incompatibility protein-domain-containing protein [Xylariaceae sp. FL0016]
MAAQSIERVERSRILEINGVFYAPTKTVRSLREEHSRVSKYDDESLRHLKGFKYHKLSSMKRRIRLLRLKPGGLLNPEITCELFEVQYDRNNIARDVSEQTSSSSSSDSDDDAKGRPIEYEALSWCWGDSTKDCGIRLEGKKDRRLAVTRDLALALKYLRLTHKDRILWIDALCINQADHEERNHQVQMMSRIYHCAEQTCIWLGEDNDDSATAISFIHDIMKLENFDAMSSNRENAPKWQSLLLFMQRPWFSRRWVVQEVSLARKATIYCGSNEIAWEQFAVAVELFVEVETATHRLSEVMLKDEAYGHVPQWFEHVSELGASVLVQATGKVFRQDGTHNNAVLPHKQTRHNSVSSNTQKEGREATEKVELPDTSPRRPLLSLEYLVSSLAVFEASQSRDVVYSLLAIARDTSPFAELRATLAGGSEEITIMSTVSSFLERKPFRVDYSRPYSDVCMDFVNFCIKGAKGADSTRALDILCRPWAPDPVDPSTVRVTHKVPTLYKFHKDRKRLWSPGDGHFVRQKSPEHPGGDGETEPLVEENLSKESSAREWMEQLEKLIKQKCPKRWDSFMADANRFLPRKPTKLENVALPKTERQDDEDDSSDIDSEKEETDIQNDDLPLPSWVARVTGAPFALFHHPGIHTMRRMGRKNADPLVGLPQDGFRNYSAAQNKKVDSEGTGYLRFRKRPALGHYSLYVKGFILSEIEQVAEPARLGSIPETWAELAGWKNAVDGKSDPPAEFWRTLVADRGKDNRNPPYYYARACKESVKKGGLRGGSVDTSALINSERNSIVAEFCRRVQAVIWNRCLIKTKDGILGLTSQKVKPGDHVCILFGCTVPVILRRAKDPKSEKELADERKEDGYMWMRARMSVIEDVCIRRLRYRNKLKQLEKEKGETQRRVWKDEVRGEMEAVNTQMKRWKERDRELERMKAEEKAEQDQMKDEAKERRKKRGDSKAAMLRRVITMPVGTLSTIGEDHVLTSVSKEPLRSVGESAKGVTGQPFEERMPQTETKKQNLQGSKVTETDAEVMEREFQERKEKARQEDPTFHYTMIGEAYIHGMMDGEAIRRHVVDGIPERLFEIR